jgi:hypothetical protein
VLVDERDELAVHLARQHHAHDIHGLGGRHPVAATELALDSEPAEHRRDLRAPAVHDDRLDARISEVDHVFCEGPLQLGTHHGVAAELHDDRLAVEALQPR